MGSYVSQSAVKPLYFAVGLGPIRLNRYSHLIPDNGVIEHAGYDRIAKRIHTEIEAGRMVYVHCCGRRGRTSTLVGCLRADAGLDYDATIAVSLTGVAAVRSLRPSPITA